MSCGPQANSCACFFFCRMGELVLRSITGLSCMPDSEFLKETRERKGAGKSEGHLPIRLFSSTLKQHETTTSLDADCLLTKWVILLFNADKRAHIIHA